MGAGEEVTELGDELKGDPDANTEADGVPSGDEVLSEDDSAGDSAEDRM